MTLDQFFEWLDTQEVDETYIVTLAYKYDWEEKYTIENEILFPDDNCLGKYVWDSDWNEGQTDVTVLGCIPLREVVTNHFSEEECTK